VSFESSLKTHTCTLSYLDQEVLLSLRVINRRTAAQVFAEDLVELEEESDAASEEEFESDPTDQSRSDASAEMSSFILLPCLGSAEVEDDPVPEPAELGLVQELTTIEEVCAFFKRPPPAVPGLEWLSDDEWKEPPGGYGSDDEWGGGPPALINVRDGSVTSD